MIVAKLVVRDEDAIEEMVGAVVSEGGGGGGTGAGVGVGVGGGGGGGGGGVGETGAALFTW